jgi:hypothetical protein
MKSKINVYSIKKKKDCEHETKWKTPDRKTKIKLGATGEERCHTEAGSNKGGNCERRAVGRQM